MIREGVSTFTDIPNVGKATAGDLVKLGFNEPIELATADPLVMYLRLCEITATRQDPCVLDVFMAAVDYMQGAPAIKWWQYTNQRKRKYGSKLP